MASAIGSLFISLGLSTAEFDKQIESVASKMGSVGKKLSAVGLGLTAGITAPLVAFGKQAFEAFGESEKAIAAVDAALKSMGDGAGYTRQQLQDMATALQKTSTFDDDEILSKVTANLLTFGRVANEEFGRAQQAAVDLSARLGTDLQQSAIMVGKALNDPIAGLQAMRRVGIQFTDDQQEMIKGFVKAGEIAKAQGVILDELARQFGGQAAAEAKTSAGQVAQAWVAVGNALESVGAIIAQYVVPVANGIKSLAEAFQQLSPETQNFIVIVAGLAAAIGPAVVVIGGLAIAIGAVGVPIAAITVAVGLLGAAVLACWPKIVELKDKAVASFQALYEGAQSYLGEKLKELFQGLQEIGAGFSSAFHRLKENVVNASRDIYEGVKSWIGDKLNAVWSSATAAIEKVNKSFKWLKDQVVGHSYIPDMVEGVEEWMDRLAASMPKSAYKATKATNDNFSRMRNDADDVLREIGSSFEDMIGSAVDGTFNLRNAIGDLLKNLGRLLVNKGFKMLFDGDGSSGGFGGLGGIISKGLGSLFGMGGGTPSASVQALGAADLDMAMGFASGGSFEVGGSGGVDSKLVSFRATPGEMVNVTKGDRPNGSAEIIRLEINPSEGWVSGIADRQIQTKSGQIVQVAVKQSQQITRRNFETMANESQARRA